MLNESRSIPDPANVDVLINNIISKIKDMLKVSVYSNAPFSGIQNDTIHDTFSLYSIYNPCGWIGNDTVIEFVFQFVPGESKCGAIFDETINGSGFIQDGDESAGIPKSIHGGKISLMIQFGRDIYSRNQHSYIDKNKLNSVFDKIKISLRHELGHAYEEISLHKKFQISPEIDPNSEEYLNNKNFIKGVSYVGYLLSNPHNLNNEYEKKFVTLLYTSSYIEINAHICGFYQRLMNDLDNGSRLSDITTYYEYATYKNNLSFINNFDDLKLFKEYHDVIVAIFGKGVDNIGIFKKRLHAKCQKAISKMEKCYRYVSENKSICGKMTLESAMTFYESYLNVVDNRFNESLSGLDKLYNNKVASLETRVEIEKLIRTIDLIFEDY